MDKSQLLEEYVRTRRPELRDLVITEYIPLVKSVCGKMSVYISGVLEMEDLYSYGIFGLIDAIDKYDPKMDNKFETYATIRIRGEVLDNVRKLDAVPRQVRKKEKEIKAAEFKLQNMGMYSEANLAAELQLPIVENPCPEDKTSKRYEIKKLLAQMSQDYPDLKSKIFGAMQRMPLPGWGITG